MSGMNLSRIKFQAGPAVGGQGLEIEPSTVLILVGPNNSGKSLALKELEDWCRGQNQSDRYLLAEIEASFPSDLAEAMALIKIFEVDPPSNQVKTSERIWVGQHTFRGDEVVHRDVPIEHFKNIVNAGNDHQLREYLLGLYTVRLDGRTRFTLSDPKTSGDLQGPPRNHLWSLFQDDAARKKVRKLTEEAFGVSFVIDPTAMKQFRIRMSDRAPADSMEEQALDQRSRDFHRQASLIAELSDGVQAFTGLVSAVMSLPHRVMLIDEPEAFLHPPLARRLGRNLAQLSAERSANLIVATHSADFVMGCVESGSQTTIVRLTYEQKVATARSLPPDEVASIMRHPLLRSTKALQGLFHRSVVVTESDTDRAFYDEINFRLSREDRGIDDTLFVNAQNWQTTSSIMGPLRSVGVPTASVLDLDTIATTESWGRLYEAAGISGSTKSRLEAQRKAVGDNLRKLPAPGSKELGIAGLAKPERAQARRLLKSLSEYGIFVVPVGEVEMWLASLGVKSKKTKWLLDVFSALGDDPEDPTYATPKKRDVWAFLDNIGEWTADPNRKGI